MAKVLIIANQCCHCVKRFRVSNLFKRIKFVLSQMRENLASSKPGGKFFGSPATRPIGHFISDVMGAGGAWRQIMAPTIICYHLFCSNRIHLADSGSVKWRMYLNCVVETQLSVCLWSFSDGGTLTRVMYIMVPCN